MNEEIAHLVNTDNRFETVKSFIITVDTLIIDEVQRYLIKSRFCAHNIRYSSILFGNGGPLLHGSWIYNYLCNQCPSLLTPIKQFFSYTMARTS